MKIRSTLFAASAALLIVAGAAHAAMWQWSQNASTNASADPSINWAEGMSPSSVNDSARAMMAAVAQWRDDISGSLSATGTASAYAVATNQGLASVPVTGQMIAFVPNVTNTAGATLTVDGGTTYPLQAGPGASLPGAVLIQGTPYTFMFNGTAWLLRNFYGNPTSVPVGTVLSFSGASAPNSNFVLAYGQCISRATYAAYFAMVNTTYGACDGSTTFGVPDLRGRVVAGMDNMGGSAAGRMTLPYGVDGTVLGAAGGSVSHTISAAESAALTYTSNSVVHDPGHSHTYLIGAGSSPPGCCTGGTQVNPVNTSVSFTGVTVTTTTASNAAGQPMTVMQPTIVLSQIIRIL